MLHMFDMHGAIIFACMYEHIRTYIHTYIHTWFITCFTCIRPSYSHACMNAYIHTYVHASQFVLHARDHHIRMYV